jgi:muramoyltetrapeptide carboxypeptidase
MTPIKAKPLAKGDAIGIVAPAGPVNRERIERALGRLTQHGLRTKTYGDIYRARGYLAGDDATRADELIAAFTDPGTSAVWCARGGYGVARLLDRLDYGAIHRHPKVLIGFSDITALHIAIGQRTGLVTFHGPNLQEGFGGADDMPAPNQAALWLAVSADKAAERESGYVLHDTLVEQSQVRTIRGGVASGRLTGGNLSVIAGLMGTPFEIETAGRVLFLEEVDERAYRVDRYLAQLRLAGKLKAAAGIVLGAFSHNRDDPDESAAKLSGVLNEYFGPLDIPVLAGFPTGHVRQNLTLPMGAQVELNADKRWLRVCECPVTGTS